MWPAAYTAAAAGLEMATLAAAAVAAELGM